MKKLLFVGNPTILGENLGNVLKSNYNTDFYYQPRDYIAACYKKGEVL